jgi:hypothetical protein
MANYVRVANYIRLAAPGNQVLFCQIYTDMNSKVYLIFCVKGIVARKD